MVQYHCNRQTISMFRPLFCRSFWHFCSLNQVIYKNGKTSFQLSLKWDLIIKVFLKYTSRHKRKWSSLHVFVIAQLPCAVFCMLCFWKKKTSNLWCLSEGLSFCYKRQITWENKETRKMVDQLIKLHISHHVKLVIKIHTATNM